MNETLKRAREKKGYSQLEVAVTVGITESAYCLYEKGRRKPRNILVAKRIAELLEIPWESLYDKEFPE